MENKKCFLNLKHSFLIARVQSHANLDKIMQQGRAYYRVQKPHASACRIVGMVTNIKVCERGGMRAFYDLALIKTWTWASACVL